MSEKFSDLSIEEIHALENRYTAHVGRGGTVHGDINYIAHFKIPVAGNFYIEKTEAGKFDIWHAGSKTCLKGFRSITEAHLALDHEVKRFLRERSQKLSAEVSELNSLSLITTTGPDWLLAYCSKNDEDRS
jgi:hypothetical protein